MGSLGQGSKSERLLVVATAGPALVLGGTPPWVVPIFAALVAALLGLTLARRRRPGVPGLAVLTALAAGFTLLQVLPIPGVREAVAPALGEWVAHAELPADTPWPGLSPAPADTSLEVVRLLALGGLMVVAAQHSWRVSAAAVALCGVLVAGVGLLQYGLGVERIYGFYEAQHGARSLSPALLSTFVNPNHQSGLLLLGLLSTAGLWVDTRDARHDHSRFDRRTALGVAMLVQVAALVLSMSRGALLCAAVVAPVAALVAWWPEAEARARRHGMLTRLAGGLTLAAVALGLGTLGAWQELQTLLPGDGLDPSTAARVRVTLGSIDLVDLAPLTGIGRGAYGDVFPAFDPAPNHVWYSHLECAPLTLVVEWGLVVGGALALALPTWWLVTVRAAGRHDDARARRVVLLGLLAVALQGLADFSLEFLGVAAPAAALAGSLSSTPRWSVASRTVRWGAVVLAGAAVASVLVVPHTWVTHGQPPASESEAIALRPLDAGRHRHRARTAAQRGDWPEVLERARVAVRLEPGHIDGWMLLAGARWAQGDVRAAERATAEALERLHDPPPTALLDYLVDRFEQPQRLARLAPVSAEPWRLLARGMLDVSAAHADALAGAWALRHPDDPEALQVHVEANLQLGRPGLALHHARLWRQLTPHDAAAHIAVARALQHSKQPRPHDVREALHRALQDARVDDLHQRGLLEEQLLRALLRIPGPAARVEARRIASALRTRPADAAVRRRWRALLRPVLEP